MPPKIDLVGHKYGRLTVNSQVAKEQSEVVAWHCTCECGTVMQVTTSKLRSGQVQSCGCLHRVSIITGERFGRLVTVHELSERIDSKIAWLCRCDCGNESRLSATRLKAGLVSSCGCLSVEKTVERNTTHQLSGSREHRIWRGMKARCNSEVENPNPNYAGKGVTVDPTWEENFETFMRDMGPAPSNQHSIDRKDNDKGYTLENCRWADNSTQRFNRGTPSHNTSGHKGVSQNKNGKWTARLSFEKKSILNQTFPSLEEALAARTEAEEKVNSLIRLKS